MARLNAAKVVKEALRDGFVPQVHRAGNGRVMEVSFVKKVGRATHGFSFQGRATETSYEDMRALASAIAKARGG